MKNSIFILMKVYEDFGYAEPIISSKSREVLESQVKKLLDYVPKISEERWNELYNIYLEILESSNYDEKYDSLTISEVLDREATLEYTFDDLKEAEKLYEVPADYRYEITEIEQI